MVIYRWHAKNNTKYFGSCLEYNYNFCSCIDALLDNGKSYDPFLNLNAGDYKNRDGSLAMHKWLEISLADVKYIFNPRLEGHKNANGSKYFGIRPGSSLGKRFISELSSGTYIMWQSAKSINSNHVAAKRN